MESKKRKIIIEVENGLLTLNLGDEQLFSGNEEGLLQILPELVQNEKITEEEKGSVISVLKQKLFSEDDKGKFTFTLPKKIYF